MSIELIFLYFLLFALVFTFIMMEIVFRRLIKKVLREFNLDIVELAKQSQDTPAVKAYIAERYENSYRLVVWQLRRELSKHYLTESDKEQVTKNRTQWIKTVCDLIEISSEVKIKNVRGWNGRIKSIKISCINLSGGKARQLDVNVSKNIQSVRKLRTLIRIRGFMNLSPGK